VIALPPGFSLFRRFALPTERLDELILSIRFEQTTFRIFGRQHLTPRLTSWMGEPSYTYSGILHPPAPVPEWVARLRDLLGHFTGTTFNSVLANLYRDRRDSVAWHADDEPELGERPMIASVSLGGSRTFAIRPRAGGPITRIELEHGDLLVMSGRSQADYLHAVPKTRRQADPRLNLTLRRIV
jgi:alkylated DNA repair dioxygenase AlkB